MTIANDITFGIEIETTIPAGAIRVGSYHGTLQAAGLPAGWLAKSDCSIRATPGRTGCEFVSPVLKGAEGVKSVMEAVAAINELGGRVNASCGIHVHVGFAGSDKQLKQLVTLVANMEKAIYAATGTKRRENGNWCRSVQQHGNADNADRAASNLRYHVLNLTNLRAGRRPAVEFRAFSASLNIVKILGYVRMCIGIVERAAAATRSTNWRAKPTKSTSPVARGGEGQTALCRLFYALGWIKGRAKQVYGDVTCEGAPTNKEIKKELMRLAKKYDAQES